jgi:hypothetical protein
MTKIILTIQQQGNKFDLDLSGQEDNPTPQEQLFTKQMAKTISDFLSNAPKAESIKEAQ